MSNRIRAFTLIELSIVVLVLALLAAAGMRYYNANVDSTALATTNASLDAVETALINFQNEYGRLPCPADITQAENVAAFGTEVDTLGDGNCTGYNYINATDPDGPAGNCGVTCDPGDPDANYDSTTLNQVVEGAVPTKALRISDRYAYDAWGNKLFYAVDKRMTATNSFANNPTYSTTIGAIAVKKTVTDTLANALTYRAIYALVSTGKNRHGGFARNISGTSIRANAGSTNSDELDNCHCSSSAVATSFNRIFVQKPKANDVTGFTNNFDDITRFKTRNLDVYNSDLQ